MQPGKQFVQYFQHSSGPEPTGNRLFTAMNENETIGHLGMYRRVPRLGKITDPESLPLESHRRYDDPGTPWSVSSLYVKPGHEHVVPTLLGLASEHAMRTSPAGTSQRMPVASHDLSKHSRRLVTKLVDYGVISDPHDGYQYSNNSITRDMAKTALANYVLPRDAEAIPESDVHRAGRHLRSVIDRHRRENRPAHQDTPLFDPDDIPVYPRTEKPWTPSQTSIL